MDAVIAARLKLAWPALDRTHEADLGSAGLGRRVDDVDDAKCAQARPRRRAQVDRR
jgi:hypothetical protein